MPRTQATNRKSAPQMVPRLQLVAQMIARKQFSWLNNQLRQEDEEDEYPNEKS